ncbi:GDP-fucose O-fucosyltransferase 1 [Brachionus plicatilis]|uniref:GDP-fucose protein O-fucosyltransferase 1 n=1 Tax=Brachionus plicatilis TaxID=10195 RepID=A0A3M7S163_BRAPC|nr:GDP-fucose O-fucosyltransferase 1 [Brachionus plicatilis]
MIILLFISLTNIVSSYQYDPNGYVFFCLCMGRFGNQADHLLGSMSFAKHLNRTLVVPPFRTYKNVPFDEWFKLEDLEKYHRIISAEDFMKFIAPEYWTEKDRIGFCWSYEPNQECKLKDGNPMENFWTELGVDRFPKSVNFILSFNDYEQWRIQFPASKYPVLAFRGAPASYPVKKQDRPNQKYLVWSNKIDEETQYLIKKYFNEEKFVGIHLRNGIDWLNACQHVEQYDTYMSSPQCLDGTNVKLNKNLCFPSNELILEKLDDVLIKKLNRTVKNIYIATDKNPMIHEIRDHFAKKDLELNLVHHDPWLPIIDLAVLMKSEYFIGNCVSSFTAFVVRDRIIKSTGFEFWAFDK